PLIFEAAGALQVRSFLLDWEAVACDGDGMPVFDRLRYRREDGRVFLYAFDLLELNGQDLPPRADRDPQAPARHPAAGGPSEPTDQRAYFRARRRHVPARLQDGSRGHRLEAARLALPLRPLARLAQDEEPSSAGGEARGRAGLGAMSKRKLKVLSCLPGIDPPKSASRFLTDVSSSALSNAPDSLVTISLGVPFGAKIPAQILIW